MTIYLGYTPYMFKQLIYCTEIKEFGTGRAISIEKGSFNCTFTGFYMEERMVSKNEEFKFKEW
jgi:hypothetical protein